MHEPIEKDTTNEAESDETLARAPRKIGLRSVKPVVGIVLPMKSGLHAGVGNKVWQDDWLAPQ
jgi:hypothetical protein